jgi:hypothetical protein
VDQLSNLQTALRGQSGVDVLFSAAQASSPLLDRCLAEARSVLRGAMPARDRLWLLLRGAAGLALIGIPKNIVQPPADAPQLMNGRALLDLVVGVARSANSQHETDAMLSALGALLDPLFLLEHAARAQQNGQAEALRTIAAAAQAASWEKLNNPAPPRVIGTWKNRVAFDTRTFSGGFDAGRAIDQYSWLWHCLHDHLASSAIDINARPYHIDSISNPTVAQLVLSATSACGSTEPLTVDFVISVIPVVNVFFLEVTQGVQTDHATQQQGGAMPLVEGKDTGVRVYMTCDRHGWFNDQLTAITGSLTVSGGSTGCDYSCAHQQAAFRP